VTDQAFKSPRNWCICKTHKPTGDYHKVKVHIAPEPWPAEWLVLSKCSTCIGVDWVKDADGSIPRFDTSPEATWFIISLKGMEV